MNLYIYINNKKIMEENLPVINERTEVRKKLD